MAGSFEAFAGPPAHDPGPPPNANASDNAGPPLVVVKQGYFYVGGEYDNPTNPTQMTGQMYVEYQIPAKQNGKGKPPIVMLHGGGHTGAGFVSTPDGRPGWADYFVRRGWPVYVVDRPGVAKSSSFGAFGNASLVSSAEDQWSAPEKAAAQWPQAHLHTQWPGTGLHGDPAFDQYYAHLAPAGTAETTPFRVKAFIALLEKIGPAIMLPHSSPGPETWQVADARPDLVAAIVSDEPSGPPFFNVDLVTGAQGALTRPWGPSVGPLAYDPPVSDPAQLYNFAVQQSQPDAPGLIRCWLPPEPARRLPRLAGVPILHILSEAGYHAPYDHCTSKYLTQAGVPNTFIRFENVGIHGNGHINLVEKNNVQLAQLIENWLTVALPASPALAKAQKTRGEE
jgi:pimeloyl-ACP methyl ester carboxylesterase